MNEIKVWPKVLLGAAILAFALLVHATRDEFPANTVVRIHGAAPVTKDELAHWVQIAGRSAQVPGGPRGSMVPDPPEYRQCIAELSESMLDADGNPPPERELRRQCEDHYQALKEQALDFLVSSRWIEREAAKHGVVVSEAQVEERLARERKTAFPTDQEFREFLRASGMTPDDVKDRLRADLLADRLRQRVLRNVKPPSSREMQAHYRKHRRQFRIPASRQVRLILTDTKAKILQAKQAIDAGMPFADAAFRFSDDDELKRKKGRVPRFLRGQADEKLDEAIFTTPPGQIAGPVNTDYGYYLVLVERHHPARQQPYREVSDQIRQLLWQQRQQAAFERFLADFTDRWRSRTVCAEQAMGEWCANRPQR